MTVLYVTYLPVFFAFGWITMTEMFTEYLIYMYIPLRKQRHAVFLENRTSVAENSQHVSEYFSLMSLVMNSVFL